MATVLLIDDDLHLLRALGDRLCYEGFSVVRAASGEEALECCRTQTPDLIVLDIRMPGMGGLGFLERLTSPAGNAPPVLIYTAHPVSARSLPHANIIGILIKPCPERLLADRIRSALTNTSDGVARDKTGAHILVCDNDADTTGRLKDLFRESGCRTTIVADGPGVLTCAAQSVPDLIMLRETLPTMPAALIPPLIAGMPSTRNTPVLVYGVGPGSEQDPAVHGGMGVRRYLSTSDPVALVSAAHEELSREMPTPPRGGGIPITA